MVSPRLIYIEKEKIKVILNNIIKEKVILTNYNTFLLVIIKTSSGLEWLIDIYRLMFNLELLDS